MAHACRPLSCPPPTPPPPRPSEDRTIAAAAGALGSSGAPSQGDGGGDGPYAPTAPAPSPSPSPYAPLQLDLSGLPLRRGDASLLAAARAAARHNREQAGPPLTPAALARILHGVAGPAFPADAWARRAGAFWGSQAGGDFGAALRAAELALRNDTGGGCSGGG